MHAGREWGGGAGADKAGLEFLAFDGKFGGGLGGWGVQACNPTQRLYNYPGLNYGHTDSELFV